MGHKPKGPPGYLYLTLCPLTGKGFAAFLPKLNAPCFAWFAGQVQECLTKKCLFVADGAMAHVAQCFDEQKLTFVKLPAACPELNPIERFFKEVRKGLKSRVFHAIEQAQERIQAIVRDISAKAGRVVSITCFPYLKNTT